MARGLIAADGLTQPHALPERQQAGIMFFNVD